MAKRKAKKKRKKQRKKQQLQNNAMNSHHLCWIRRRWRGKYAHELRSCHYCIVKISQNGLHRAIHNHMWGIPVPSEINAKDALEHLQMLKKYSVISDDDPIEKRLVVLIALFDCCEQRTADGFREQLKIVRKYNEKPH